MSCKITGQYSKHGIDKFSRVFCTVTANFTP